jgi:hypothetical protein
VYRINVVKVTLTTGIMILLLTCLHFCVYGILRRWSACAPIAHEVVRDYRKFEKHWHRKLGGPVSLSEREDKEKRTPGATGNRTPIIYPAVMRPT